MNSKLMKIVLLFVALFGLTVSAQSQTGKITGKLTYPGEGIPRDLVLCVKNTQQEPTFCSNTPASKLREAKIVFKLNYRLASYDISLPGGTYYLYAATNEMRGHRAYYNDFVRCGMSVDCKSKKPIAVTVKAGQIVRGITVGDFWDD